MAVPQRVLVPQRVFRIRGSRKREFRRESPIKFALKDQDGISLQDAMDEKYEGLIGRDDGTFLEPTARRSRFSFIAAHGFEDKDPWVW